MTSRRIMTMGGLAILAIVFLLPGCGGTKLGNVAGKASQARLVAVPYGSDVLLSIHGGRLPVAPLDLGGGGRELNSIGEAVLVVVAQATVPKLAATEGVERIVIWGRGDDLGRLDPMLRADLLSRIGTIREDDAVAVVGTFAAGSLDPTADLVAKGVRVGSRTGGIVTMEATPCVLLDVLNRGDLVKLEKPELMQPSTMR
jgi:hypothetical protein